MLFVICISYSSCEKHVFPSNYHLEFRIIILILAVVSKKLFGCQKKVQKELKNLTLKCERTLG